MIRGQRRADLEPVEQRARVARVLGEHDRHRAQRLDRVGQAMELAQHAYSDALEEHAQLVGLLDGYVAKARASGVAELPDLAESERAARALLERRPCPMVVARQLVATYQTWLAKEITG